MILYALLDVKDSFCWEILEYSLYPVTWSRFDESPDCYTLSVSLEIEIWPFDKFDFLFREIRLDILKTPDSAFYMLSPIRASSP